ncbi:MAG: tetratricopeptide repeat protein [Candidatus Contendobacter sp.]|nr:tetratricopeptide repeat protein [Candidatus Contendobacter sp.]
MEKSTLGKIITFYSYKGGTGRTMALANTACLLARRLSAKEDAQSNRPRIVAIDWDFEAPGLHRYFQPYFTATAVKFSDTPGCLDLFRELAETRSAYDPKDFVGNRQRALKDLERLDFERYLLETTIPGLSVIKSGRYDADYVKRVSQFDWDELFHATLGLFSGFADFLRARFDYVLVDSRTGITDTSGICTMLLPDKLVVVFTPNQQSFTGIDELVRKAVAYRKNFPDGRPLTVFPLPSRIEMARPQLFEVWRLGPGSETTIQPAPPPDLVGYQPLFEQLLGTIYSRPDISLAEYFNEIMLQQIPDYAYGEPIAVELETSDSRISLRRSYEAFADRLVELDVPWQSLATARQEREILRRCDEAKTRVARGMIEEALRLGYALLERKPPPNLFPRVAQTILEIARVAYPQARQGASALVQTSAKLALAQNDIDVAELAAVLKDAGELCLEFGDYEDARHYFEECYRRSEGAFGKEHPATLAAETGLGRAFYSLGRYDKARALQERLLSLQQRLLGEEHPSTLETLNNLASTLYAQGDLSGARVLQERVLELSRRLLGEEHPDTLTAMINLAAILSAQGDLVGAHLLEDRVLEERRRLLSEEHPDTLVSMNNLAKTLRAQGELADARRLQEQAFTSATRTLGDTHPTTLQFMRNFAELLKDLGEKEQALELFSRALDLSGKTMAR